jgi:hypothetical protein
MIFLKTLTKMASKIFSKRRSHLLIIKFIIKAKDKKIVFIDLACNEPIDAERKKDNIDRNNDFINLSLFDLSIMLQCKAVNSLITV